MKSSPKKIIRGAEVSGIMFCNTKGKVMPSDTTQKEEQESLKALEVFWYKKGIKEGRKAGFEEGAREGEKEGYRKGFLDGKKDGFEEGKNTGKEQGLQEAQDSDKTNVEGALGVLSQASQQFGRQRDEMLQQMKRGQVQLVFAICEKVLRRELSNSEVLKGTLESMLSQAQGIIDKSASTQVLLSPEDYNLLEEELSTVQAAVYGAERLDFGQDPEIQRGGCRIETPLGIINFDVKRQLENLEDMLIGR
jgi:flagellar assembly protein FliH